MADQDVERNDPATPHKLQRARDKGQAGRSPDLVAAIVFASAMAFAAGQGWELALAVVRLCKAALGAAGSAAPPWPLIAQVTRDAGTLLLPFLLVLLVAAGGGTLVQAGWVFSLEPLKADFSRLDPATGLRRVFSLRSLFDGGRACAKLLALLLVGWFAVRALPARMPLVASLSPWSFLRELVAALVAVGWQMALALLLLAGLDVVFSRREFARRMRMSRRELKDENKEREGDPRIRGRLRELRRELLKRSRALRNTREADVVVTNPTHYAVALRYVHGEMPVPTLVAKGAGHLAAAMRDIAWRHRVMVVQNPLLARRLFREVDIDQGIPPAFHAEVARVIVWVFAARAQRSRGAAA
jgi:flagellar biosynthetic protein FlhB